MHTWVGEGIGISSAPVVAWHVVSKPVADTCGDQKLPPPGVLFCTVSRHPTPPNWGQNLVIPVQKIPQKTQKFEYKPYGLYSNFQTVEFGKPRPGFYSIIRLVFEYVLYLNPPSNPFPTTGGLINFRDFGFHTPIVSKLDGFWWFSRFLLMVKSVVAIIFKTTKQSPRKIIFSIFPGSDKVHTVKTP